MAVENKTELAQKVFQLLCNTLDARNLRYDKDDEKLVLHLRLDGEDIPMKFLFCVDAPRQLVRVHSPFPFKMSEDKRLDGAIAACYATYGMVDGNFDYDITDGSLQFRLTAAYRDDQIGDGFFMYLIGCCNAMVDKFNDRFLALSKGYIDISDFMKDE